MDLSFKSLKKMPPALVATLVLINGFVNIVFAILPESLIREHDFTEASEYVSMVAYQQASSILTVIVGLILITLGIGLYHKRRIAWAWSIVMLLLLNIENIYPSLKYIPLSLGIFSLCILVIFYRQFSERKQVTETNTVIAGLSVLFAMGYGSIGSYLLRSQFNGIHSFNDAIYFTLVTYSTVGYGDITPVSSDAKLFVITMILMGIGAFATVITVLLGPILERRLKKVFIMVEQLNHMRGHAIFSYANEITFQMARDMKKHGIDVVFIVNDDKTIMQLERLKYNVINGEITNKGILKKAAILDAKYFVATDDQDGETILTLLNVKKYLTQHAKNRRPEIIAILDKPENATSAIDVGADKTIIPALLASKELWPN